MNIEKLQLKLQVIEKIQSLTEKISNLPPNNEYRKGIQRALDVANDILTLLEEDEKKLSTVAPDPDFVAGMKKHETYVDKQTPLEKDLILLCIKFGISTADFAFSHSDQGAFQEKVKICSSRVGLLRATTQDIPPFA